MRNNIESEERTILRADGTRLTEAAPVMSEHNLTVYVNGQRLFRLVCTKDHLEELVVGRLFTEGLIRSKEDIAKMYFCRYQWEANVLLNREIDWSEWQEPEPSCCAGNRVYAGWHGRSPLQKLAKAEWKPEWIFDLVQSFLEGMEIHRLTHATHSCLLAKGGSVVFDCEDIGRHNAIDKAVGYAVLHGEPLAECMLFTTGRVPVDMVQKVIAAGIPILVSKSVPTAESIGLAEEYGLTLICCAYPDQMEIYA